MRDILSTLNSTGSFHTLLSVLETTGLAGMLAEGGQFTLFASNDEAFQRMNMDELTADADKLASLLAYHIVERKLTSTEIGHNDHLATRNGKSLTVRRQAGKQMIDNAGFVTTDIECSNGMIHVIDNVFLPKFSGWYCGGCC